MSYSFFNRGVLMACSGWKKGFYKTADINVIFSLANYSIKTLSDLMLRMCRKSYLLAL